jgi:uncharacterized protein YprB with RNaseH-like and TPR domain
MTSMESSTLRSRLRSVVGGQPRPAPDRREDDGGREGIEAVTDGRWSRDRDTGCVVIDNSTDVSRRHGDADLAQVERFVEGSPIEAALAAGSSAAAPFVFLDLETTGLNGGAGTYPFLIGCAWFECGRFVTRQFLVTRLSEEPSILAAAAQELGRAGTLVSFNGKSFDAPMLETRFAFHRMPGLHSHPAHLDVLHLARAFWASAPALRDGPCSVLALERELFGARRIGDVPGHEVPARYFQFLRTGDTSPLAAVVEHNRLDLLSLACITGRLFQLIGSGPSAVRHPVEALALGRVYARGRLELRAIDAFRRAIEMIDGRQRADLRDGSEADGRRALKIAALRALALTLRRTRRFDEAAACWRGMLAVPGCPSRCDREANEALAIHHEHRVRDLRAAHSFAMRLEPARSEAARLRVARIERKMERARAQLTTRSLIEEWLTGYESGLQ